MSLDGGASGGAGIAGGGGHLFFITSDGDLTVGGKLSLRGGDAPDAGGTGGLGGAVDIFSDANFDGFGGNLLIDNDGRHRRVGRRRRRSAAARATTAAAASRRSPTRWR